MSNLSTHDIADSTCANCGGDFEKKANDYKRQAITSKISGTGMSVLDVLNRTLNCQLSITPAKIRCLCHTCTATARQYALAVEKSSTASTHLKSSATGEYMKRKLCDTQTTPHCTPQKKGGMLFPRLSGKLTL